MRNSVDVPQDFIDAVRRFVPLACASKMKDPSSVIDVLAVDPGNSTGLCALPGIGRPTSSEEPKFDVGAFAFITFGDTRFHVYVREGPYTVTAKAMENASGSIASQWGLGHSAGVADALLRRHLRDDVAAWHPMPSQWRAVLGLNVRKTATRTAREMTNDAVHAWAAATVGRPLMTERGRKHYDEANAIGMAFAARTVVRGILLEAMR